MPGDEDATAGCHGAHVLAMTVMPGQKGTAGVEEIPDPDMQDGALLVGHSGRYLRDRPRDCKGHRRRAAIR
jgi:hypothetical protein